MTSIVAATESVKHASRRSRARKGEAVLGNPGPNLGSQPTSATAEIFRSLARSAGRMLDVQLPSAIPAPTLQEFIRAVRLKDEAPSRDMIAALLASGLTASTLLIDLITPAAREFGRMWEEDSCTFFEVTLTSGRLQSLIHELRAGMTPLSEPSGRSALLCGLPGEDHTLGLSILAEYFTLDGWAVTIGPPFLNVDPADLASQAWYDVIGFSVARDEALLPLKRTIARTRKQSLNRNALFMVGGRAIDADPETIALVDADAGGVTAAEAVRDHARHTMRAD